MLLWGSVCHHVKREASRFIHLSSLTRTAPAEVASFPSPTQIVSNGEFVPLPQTREQARVDAQIKELADGPSARGTG